MAANYEVLNLLKTLKGVMTLTLLSPLNYTEEDKKVFNSAVDLINEYAGHGITGEEE